MLNFCPLCVAEVYTLRCDAMLAGTSHYPLHRPTTTYYFGARNRHRRWSERGRNRLSDKGCHPFYEFPYDSAKICSFSLFAKPVLINFKKVYQNGYSIFKFSHFDNVSLNFLPTDPSLSFRMPAGFVMSSYGRHRNRSKA